MLTFGCDCPKVVSMGTDKAKTPESRYDFQRVTIWRRYSCSFCSWGAAEETKKSPDRSEVIVRLKSGGVTSDTNHGISLGLDDASTVSFSMAQSASKDSRYALKDNSLHVGRICNQEIGKDEVSEYLHGNC